MTYDGQRTDLARQRAAVQYCIVNLNHTPEYRARDKTQVSSYPKEEALVIEAETKKTYWMPEEHWDKIQPAPLPLHS